MTKQEAYKIVYEDIMENVPFYNGNHDVKYANHDFILGIKSFMEYIEYRSREEQKEV